MYRLVFLDIVYELRSEHGDGGDMSSCLPGCGDQVSSSTSTK